MAIRTGRIQKLVLAAVSALALIVVTAVAGLAAVKTFTFTVSPTSVIQGTTGQVFSVSVTNTTSSATINSFKVQVPSDFTVTGAALNGSLSSNPNASATATRAGQLVKVQFLDPLKKGQTATVDITADVTSVSSCGGGEIGLHSAQAATTVSGEWIVTPYTGSNLTGNTFARSVHRTTNIVCGALSFSVPPSDAEKDTTITPPVEVATDPAASGVSVTLSIGSGPGNFGGTSTTTQTTDGSGVATFGDLQIDTAGAYSLVASADGYDSVTSDPFTIFESSLDCSSESPQSFAGTDTSVQLNGDCSSAPATVTDDTVSFGKPEEADTQFEITIAWGLPAGPYPDYGHTTITVNGLTFTPNMCAVVGGVPQHPVNPDVDGFFWPNGSAEQPWCVASSSVEPHHFGDPEDGFDAYQLTETFLGSGDPSFTTCRTCK